MGAPLPNRRETAMSLSPGQTQYLRYGNTFLRGRHVSDGCVQVSWGSGFFQSVNVDNWTSRGFLQHPQAARVLEGEEAAQAEAFFQRASEPAALMGAQGRDMDPAALGRAFLATLADPAVSWRDRPLSEFCQALTQRLDAAAGPDAPRPPKA